MSPWTTELDADGVELEQPVITRAVTRSSPADSDDRRRNADLVGVRPRRSDDLLRH
ncbi:MAG: hypothetical protein ACYCVN_10730 [Acidimicrobiales bacterium]